MAATTHFSFIDHSGEISGFKVNTPTLDATNVDDYTDTTIGTPLGNFKAAVDAITLCNEVKISIGAAEVLSIPGLPADNSAQREIKLLVRYADTVLPQHKGSFEIPGPNMSLVAQVGTDVVDMGNAFVLALITAFEAGYRSMFGNPVEVYGVSIVGRNI
jgi:hypothetical protein